MEVNMSSPVPEISQMENDGGHDGAVKLSKSPKSSRREAKKKLKKNLELLDKQEDAGNPETSNVTGMSSLKDHLNSGLVTTAAVDQKMAVLTPAVNEDGKSSVSGMENDGGHVVGVELSRSQINISKRAIKKKMNKSLESLDKQEDTENAKSTVTAMSSHFSNKQEVHFSNISVSPLPDKSNSGLGTTAIVDQKTTVSAVAATGDGKSSNSGMQNDKGNGAAKLTKTQRKKMRKLAGKEANAMTGGQTKSKKANRRPTIGEILDPLYLQKLEAASGKGSGTTAADKPASKQSKTEKNVNRNPAMGCGDTHDKVIAEKVSGASKVFEATNGEMVATKSAVPDVTMVPKGEQHKEVGNGNTATDNSASKKKKRQENENTNSASGDIMKTCDKVIEEKCLGTTKSIEAISSEMVTGKNAIPDASMVLKVEELTEAASGKTATDIPASKKKRGRGNKKKNAALGDIMITCGNTQEKVTAENVLGITKSIGVISSEMVTGKNAIPDVSVVSKVEEHVEVANGKTATDITASKKKRRRGNKKKNPALGDITITCGNTQEKVIAESGLGIISSEMVTGKNAIPDSPMVSKVEDHTEVANGKTATDNPASKKKSSQGSKKKNSALGDIKIIHHNTQEKVIAENDPDITKSIEAISSELVTGKNAISDASMVSKVEEHTEVASGKKDPGTAATDITASKKRKRQKLKKKSVASDGILSTGESAQDTVIVNKVSGTNKLLEASSTESKREDVHELLGGEKTITGYAESTMLKTTGCTKVGNSEIGSTGTTTTAQNSPLPKKTSRQRKKQKSVALNTINNTEVKQITQVATLGKKLVIFDVNGLLADIVSPRPKDAKADKLIPKRAIFKRPFLDDFLRFCFERFNVGIWSSRTKPVLDPVVDFLLGDLKNKLLFLWDASQCTNSGLRTLEDRHKPLVFKDLKKIWEKKDHGNRWVKGTFNESNTLLLDDSPYKALLNPKHSGIFPVSYTYKNKGDDFLGPKGELRTYLEGLAAADNSRSYVEQHPFGQGAIDEKNPHWSYYSRALKGQNR